jgi:hypothetical protein
MFCADIYHRGLLRDARRVKNKRAAESVGELEHKNQGRCPESTGSFVVLMKETKKRITKKAFMNEFLLLALVMIYLAIRY